MTVPIQMFIGNVTLDTSSGTSEGVPFNMFKGINMLNIENYKIIIIENNGSRSTFLES
jgi:hypothetical protein